MPEDKDTREEILSSIPAEYGAYAEDLHNDEPLYNKSDVLKAMDERARRMCMDLLQWMAENNVDCRTGLDQLFGEEKRQFRYKGEWITKEQLFKNFL